MTIHITHNAEACRFEAHIDGHSCECCYQRSGNVLTFTHTCVPAALEGRGIAAALVAAALAWAREQRLRVVPACSYVALYMQRHPETLDLK